MTEDLDAQIRRVDPDRWLSSRFIADAQARADVVTLYAYDHELARAPKVTSNPLLGEIRLTWWREMLDEAFDGRPVRKHPTAQALADVISRRGVPREPLEAMIDGRYRELDPTPMPADDALAWARDTAGVAAELAAGLLAPGGDVSHARGAGAAWAMARQASATPALQGLADRMLKGAREGVGKLDAAAFPAVAHAALIGHVRGPVRDRLRLTWAVARGRI